MRPSRSAFSLALLLSAVSPCVFAASAKAQSWTQIGPTVVPETRDGAALVYDPVRKEMVLFGGRALDPSDETWILEGDVWTQRAPAHAPQARSNPHAFWDSQRQRVTLFGGTASGQIDQSVLWSWDGNDWSSFQPANSPPSRRDAAVAYDSVRDRIVLFGGVVDGSPDTTLADTWEFDGTTWSDKTPETSPGDRGAALMGYDPVRQISVLVNGYSEAMSDLRRDTWTYDGSTWTEVPSANAPQGSSLEILWNPSQQKLMIVGRKETGTLTSWTFDGVSWAEQATSSHSLNGIPEASLAFDSDRGVAIYLREEGQDFRGYQLEGSTWSQVLPVPQPGGIDVGRSVMIFDTAAQEPRLFADASGDLQGWRWDGTMWRLMPLTGDHRPNAVSRIAYDAGRSRVVAFDGLTYELVDNGWTTQTSASAPSTSGAITFDEANDRLVYFGGSIAFAQYADTTWTRAGSGWQQLTTSATPPARRQAALAYDERRQRVVMFGGLGIVDTRQRHLIDTWELSGSTWTQSPAAGPTDLRDTPSMAYDQSRQRVVLWAAQDDDEAQLWEYDGTTWVGTEAPPIFGASGVLAYDAAGKRLLLHDANGLTWARGASTTAPDEPGTGPDAGTPGDGPDGMGAGGGDGDGAGSGTGGDGDADGGTGKRGGDGSSCAAVPGAADGRGAWAWVALVAVAYRRRRARRAAV